MILVLQAVDECTEKPKTEIIAKVLDYQIKLIRAGDTAAHTIEEAINAEAQKD